MIDQKKTRTIPTSEMLKKPLKSVGKWIQIFFQTHGKKH